MSLEVLLRLGDGPRLRWVRCREVVVAGDLEVLRAWGRRCMCLEAAMCVWRREMERDGGRREWGRRGREVKKERKGDG